MRTELVFILDRSGSMAGLEKDTIGGFNSMIDKQKQLDGEATVTTVLFDDHYEVLHDRINLKGISPLTENEYFVRGTTSLLDAIGKTIAKMKEVEKATLPEARAEKVMFVITTDGEENSSKEYSIEQIKKVISMQKELGWEFVFLGANIDAIQTATSLGLHADDAVDYIADSKGTEVLYMAVNETIAQVRSNGAKSKRWKEQIEKDFYSRKK